MRNDISQRIKSISSLEFDFTSFEEDLQKIKAEYVAQGNEEEAKNIWICETIVDILKMHLNAYSLLNDKSYYEGWCELERIEIALSSLKKHYQFDNDEFHLKQIEKSVKNLQVIFPYRLFGSSELLKKKKKCSICDQEISIRNSCGHIVGEIYNGELCYRIVTEVEILGLSLVENPGNKYSVMFTTDERTGEKIDQYNYDTVDYLFNLIDSPFEKWDLEVSQREVTKEDLHIVERNDPCSCGSGKKFKKCCLLTIGNKYPHYEFILKNPSNIELLTNTLKKDANKVYDSMPC